jgi:integrase/recombinase XerD
VQHFMRTLHITSYDELRKVDHRAVIAWERMMREIDEAEPSTIRRRLAALSVEDLHQNRGFDSLRIVRKGGRRDARAIHPNVAQRIRAYLDAAGHADDLDGPMFRPLSHNRKHQESRRYMDPDAIDRVLRKHAAAIGLTRGYSAHSMRATFITTALENGPTLDDVQRAAGHSEPSTTKLYDREQFR